MRQSDIAINPSRYERPWGFGNTAVCYYDPVADKVTEELELDRASSIYSNAETPGHGKIHGNIASDSKGMLYFAGYMGMSYMHEFTVPIILKAMQEAPCLNMILRPKMIDYFGIPCPYGATVGFIMMKRGIP